MTTGNKKLLSSQPDKDSSVSTSAATNTMESLLGEYILRGSEKVKTQSAMQGKDIVLLYFSALWCPPCKAFTPVLSEMYASLHQSMKMEVVFVSSDKSVEDFHAYYGKMPWLSIALENTEVRRNLANMFQISGIPALIVLDVKTGYIITNSARNDVFQAAGNVAKYNDVVLKWKSTTPVPIEQGLPPQAIFTLKGVVMSILKNPTYIIGLVYLIKWLVRQYLEYGMKNNNSGGLLATDDDPAKSLPTEL